MSLLVTHTEPHVCFYQSEQVFVKAQTCVWICEQKTYCPGLCVRGLCVGREVLLNAPD